MGTCTKMKIIVKKTNKLSNSTINLIVKMLNEHFKSDELRAENSQKATFLSNEYYISYCVKNSSIIGAMLWWDFHNYRFIEYLCVSKNEQNNQIGSKLLDTCIVNNKIVIVEVLENKKLKNFYYKKGFVENSYEYLPITLQETSNKNNYKIFSYKKGLTITEYNSFLEIIHAPEYQF